MEEAKIIKRKMNWLPQETHLLLQQLQEHKSVLRDKCCPQRLKRAAWASITKIINDAHGNGRKQEEVEKRWQNVKFKAMKERSEYKKALSQTGGGPLPMIPDDTNKLIWDILGRDSECVCGIEVDEVEDKSAMYQKINGMASASQPTSEVDQPHFTDADECTIWKIHYPFPPPLTVHYWQSTHHLHHLHLPRFLVLSTRSTVKQLPLTMGVVLIATRKALMPTLVTLPFWKDILTRNETAMTQSVRLL